MITSTKFYKEYREGLVLGLTWGLVAGLVAGLVEGLVLGLVAGLALGLTWGLVLGLVGGLVWGLGWGLVVLLTNFSEAFPFINGLGSWLLIILGFIVLIEIFFWLDKKRPQKKENRLIFTLKRKGEALLESLMVFSFVGQIYVFGREVLNKDYLPAIMKWIGYIGAGIILLVFLGFIIYLYLKLNSLKYKK